MIPVAFRTRRSAGRCAAASRSCRRAGQIAGIVAGADLLPRLREHLARGVDRERIVARLRELVDRGEIAKLHARHDSPPRPLLHCQGEARDSRGRRRWPCSPPSGRPSPARSSTTARRSPASACSGSTSAASRAAEIESALAAWSRRPVTIRAGGRSYHVPRGWLVSVDARATAARALSAGSPVALVVPLHEQVAPVLARAGGAGDVLREIARAERPAVSAAVTLHGTTVVVTPAQIGRQLDRGALLTSARRRREHDRRAVRRGSAGDPRSRCAQRRVDRARAARPSRSRSRSTARGSGRSRRTSSRTRCGSSRASIATRSRSTPSRSPGSCARASVAGSCARTTRSSPSPATASTSFRHDPVATSTRRGSQRPSRLPRTATASAQVELGAARPRPDDRRRERARDPPQARLVHDADGRVVVEPDPQRAPDGRLHRRHRDRARAETSRSTTSSASARPSAASSRARRSSARSSCRRSAAASARPRRRSSTTRSSSGCRSSRGRTTTSTSRTTRSAATRRCRGEGPTSSSATT